MPSPFDPCRIRFFIKMPVRSSRILMAISLLDIARSHRISMAY
jgi:hypothetical protein